MTWELHLQGRLGVNEGRERRKGPFGRGYLTTKTKLLRARCDLGMERSHMWVEHRVGLCIQTRVAGGGAGNDGRKNPMM